ncbi:MAG: signal peptidase I [Blautia sp.]|jgi:signal peptidase I
MRRRQTKPEIFQQPLTVEQLEQELKREIYKKRYRRVLRSTVYTLITVAAAAVLAATLLLPVLRIYGTSMTPTLENGDIVAAVKGSKFERGNIIAFWLNNKILVKRVIAQPGEWVDIDEDGNVSVNGEPLKEPYLAEKALGECDIDLPYQVPEGRIFVMGDHRSTSLDSRNSTVGCVAEEQIVGKLMFQIWPIEGFGLLD